MAARSIASLTLGFGLVAIPVKLYTATEPTAAIRFKLMGRQGARLRQQYVVDAAPVPEWEDSQPPAPERFEHAAPVTAKTRATSATFADAERPAPSFRSATSVVQPLRPAPERLETECTAARLAPADSEQGTVSEPEPEPAPAVVRRTDMLKGYEFEKGRFVLFTPAELKALEGGARHSIDIVAFIPGGSVDPVYYDKAYYLAPERQAVRTYSLLLETLRRTGRAALAKWAWRGKEYVVEVRAASGGLVLQQLLYAEEVRAIETLRVPTVPVSEAELALATQLVDTIAEEGYDPSRFVDEERRRILEAIEAKVAGRRVVAHEPPQPGSSAEVIDLMEALRASLRQQAPRTAPASASRREAPAGPGPARKPARRAPAAPVTPLAASGGGRTPAKSRARK